MGQTFGEQERVARKAHVCFWCGEEIEPKHKYLRWIWADIDIIEVIKTHPECALAWCDEALALGYQYEAFPYEHARGCGCESGSCKCVVQLRS